MTRGEQLLHEALNAWADYHCGCEQIRSLLTFLEGDEYVDAKTHVLAALESMIAAERQTMLYAHYDRVCGGIANAKPQHYQPFQVDSALMARLQSLVGFYSAPRAFLHLYLHARMYHVLGRNTPLNELNDIVERWT